MKQIETIEGNLTPNDGKYAIVVGRWNAFVVESLLEGAVDSLMRHGVEEQHGCGRRRHASFPGRPARRVPCKAQHLWQRRMG